jgi:hypothetical protein
VKVIKEMKKIKEDEGCRGRKSGKLIEDEEGYEERQQGR